MYDAHDIQEVIARLVDNGVKRLTTDDVWDEIGHDAELSHPNGVMGKGFTLARDAGVIKLVDCAPVQSSHPARKGGAIRVWEPC